jgi:hypothetical protein
MFSAYLIRLSFLWVPTNIHYLHVIPWVQLISQSNVFFELLCALQILKQASSSSTLRSWDAAELEELCQICGFVDYKSIRRNNFIMLSASKPE